MAFYAGRVVVEPPMQNPTLVVLTDRNDDDLDDQLFGTFSRCHELLRQARVQAQDRANLGKLLQVASGGVVFTTIQKFLPEEKGCRYPLLSDRRNIVVIADEAHRRVTKEDVDKMVGGQALSESPPLPRIGFYVYCRQNGRWPHEVAGLDPDTEADKFEPYCPERLVSSTYPPTLLLHGDRDTDVPFQMSERMAAALSRQGVEHRLYRMAGFDHMFDVFPEGPPPAARAPRMC